MSITTTTIAPDLGTDDRHPRRRAMFAGFALVGLAVGSMGYLLGTATSDQGGVRVYTGRAYSTEVQIGVEAANWSFDVPLDVPWKDAYGGWHSGERPACLPPTGNIPAITFGAVNVKRDGFRYRPVVWVDCSNSTP
jgi:hypothetical protein